MAISERGTFKSKESSGRLLTVDITKGIGFFLVVLGHLVSADSKTSLLIFSFHMPLFYLMSGYLMPSTVSRQNFKKRMLSLLLNYMFFSLIGLIVSLIITSWRNGLSLQTIAYDVFYNTQPECIHVGQIWFLFSMIWGTLLFFEIHFIFRKNEVFAFIFSMLVGALSVVSSKLNIQFLIREEVYGIPFKLLPGMSALIFIELGYVAKKYQIIDRIDSIKVLNRILIAMILLAVTILLALRNIRVNIALGLYGNIPLYYLTSVLGTFAIVFFSSAIRGKIGNCIGFYGKNSLAFFSFHSLLLYAYAKVLSIVFGQQYTIMKNINIPMSVVGMVLIILLIIPFKYLYDHSAGCALTWVTKK